MPVFATPFAGSVSQRKLNDAELIRAIRYAIAAEYEAIQLYVQLSESIDNERAAAVLKDIANEERVHVGEFLRLLRDLSSDEQKFYAEGADEVEEMFSKLAGEAGEAPAREKGTETHLGMPYCRLAADPEHSRAYVEEEPCDDDRAGRYEEGRINESPKRPR